MESLIIEAITETPKIELNGKEGYFLFTGKSYPENVNTFYSPIITYLELYLQDPKDKTSIDFNWIYYNTATSKIIVKIIMLLKQVVSKGKQFEINWYCKEDDDLMLEKGEELKEILNINFNIQFINSPC